MPRAAQDDLSPGVFGAVLAPPQRTRARDCALVLLAAVLHALPALAVLAHTRQARADPAASAPALTFLVAPAAAPRVAAVAPTDAASRSTLARRTAARRLRPPTRPSASLPDAAPGATAPEAGVEWTAELPTLDVGGAGEGGPRTLGARVGTGRGLTHGLPGGCGGPCVPVLLPAAERTASLEAYVEALIRRHFRHVRYPHLAAASGLEGTVTVRVAVAADGRVLSMRLEGACPHPVLCDAAEAAVRGHQPLPRPPPELGSPVEVDLPFRYFIAGVRR